MTAQQNCQAELLKIVRHLLHCMERRDTFERSFGEQEAALRLIAEKMGPDTFVGQLAEIGLQACRRINRAPVTLADVVPTPRPDPIAELLGLDVAILAPASREVMADFQSKLRAAIDEDAPPSARRRRMEMRRPLEEAKTRAKLDKRFDDARLLQAALVQVGIASRVPVIVG